ncbi:MAG: hypothetical protein AAB849_01505 [Patescibacteria group bacterium]
MTLSRYLIIMTVATFLCWVAWFLVLFNINPYEASVWSFLAFYISLFLALAGTFTVIGFGLRVWLFKQNDPHFHQVKKTFRHGMLFGALLIIAMFLQSQRLLHLWNTFLLIFAFAFLEFFFISSPKET